MSSACGALCAGYGVGIVLCERADGAGVWCRCARNDAQLQARAAEASAATRIQASFRGRTARHPAPELPDDSQSENEQSPEPQQQGEEEEEHHTLVTVPVGAQPGEEISALLPDGREIELHVPEGAQPGDEIEVHVPSDEGEEEGHAQQDELVEEDQEQAKRRLFDASPGAQDAQQPEEQDDEGARQLCIDRACSL